ncbi:MAG: YlxM family DNA-binding protein [Clostridiales Family XIII bacterium]|jgi:predicted DNA-binding protein YlxM (UPF0122 family)|nr:YlxM family DNA-binding protein [Clostridiales Family XIII bacterium]
MQFEETAKMNLLFDFYGGLLTEKQRLIFRSYYEDDLSLAEIADNIQISRQGVHDALRKASASLEEHESKLCLIRRFKNVGDIAGRAKAEIDRVLAEHPDDAGLETRLRSVRAMIDKLEE